MDINLKVNEVVGTFGQYVKNMVSINDMESEPVTNAFTILMSSQSSKSPGYLSYFEVRNSTDKLYNRVIDFLQEKNLKFPGA